MCVFVCVYPRGEDENCCTILRHREILTRVGLVVGSQEQAKGLGQFKKRDKVCEDQAEAGGVCPHCLMIYLLLLFAIGARAIEAVMLIKLEQARIWIRQAGGCRVTHKCATL